MSLDLFAALAAVVLSDPSSGAKPAALEGDKIECRTEVRTESRVGRKRICATKRVWDQIRDEHLESNAHRKVDAERSKPCTSFPCR